MTRPTGLDPFAAVEGLALGFEQTGFDVVGAVEIGPVHLRLVVEFEPAVLVLENADSAWANTHSFWTK